MEGCISLVQGDAGDVPLKLGFLGCSDCSRFRVAVYGFGSRVSGWEVPQGGNSFSAASGFQGLVSQEPDTPRHKSGLLQS